MKVYILVFALFMACGSTKNVNKEEKHFIENQGVKFEMLIASSIGGYLTPQIKVIKEQESLLDTYSQLNKYRKPAFSIPTINFEKETIVAVFMGQKNTGGYSVSIVDIVDKGEKIVVKVKETKPNENEMVTMAITQPFCIVKVDNAAKEMVFVKVP